MQVSKKQYHFGPHILIKPEQIFFENEHVFAFVNLRPVIPGHVLICPKRVA